MKLRPSELFDPLYTRVAGRYPEVRPWHVQSLEIEYLRRDLQDVLPTVGGDVVDVGCGDKPYETWLRPGSSIIGLDTEPGPAVDMVVDPNRPWPLNDETFDAALCTQVLEHVSDPDEVLEEICRVLKPGGRLVAIVPFSYPVHAPDDYRRFSTLEMRRLLEPEYEIEELRTMGAVGSTTAVYFLHWLDDYIRAHRLLRLARTVLLPLWVLFGGLVNIVARILDRLDSTGYNYSNILVVARKRARVEIDS